MDDGRIVPSYEAERHLGGAGAQPYSELHDRGAAAGAGGGLAQEGADRHAVHAREAGGVFLELSVIHFRSSSRQNG